MITIIKLEIIKIVSFMFHSLFVGICKATGVCVYKSSITYNLAILFFHHRDIVIPRIYCITLSEGGGGGNRSTVVARRTAGQ